MIQWYDDRPGDPTASFIYFERIFRKQFLASPLSKDGMQNYVMRLLVAKRELRLSILPKWEFRQGYENEFEQEMFSRFNRQFDEEMFLSFQRDVLSIIPILKEKLADPGSLQQAAIAHSKGDYVTALSLLPRLANRGDSVAQSLLGLMYAQGQGVQKSNSQAEKWYRLSFEQGNLIAKKLLAGLYSHYARLYETGEEDHPKMQSEALRWLHEAADLGDAAAQNNLGVKYLMGDGVQQDFVRAFVLFSLSAEDGDLGTLENLAKLSKRMSLEQIREGKQLVHEQKTAQER